MNLNHRLADSKKLEGLDVVFHKLEYPAAYVIPVMLLGLSLVSVSSFLSEPWEVGPFSTGVLPTFISWIAQITQADIELLTSQTVFVGYALSAVTFYAFVYLFTRRHLPAILTSLFTLLPFFPFSTSLSPRLHLLLDFRDGAHITGLTFMPLAVLAFHRFIRNSSWRSLGLYAFFTVLTAMVSLFTVSIMFVFMMFVTISEILVDQGRTKLKRFSTAVGVLFVCIIAVYNLSLIDMFVSEEGRITLSVLVNFLPLNFFLVPILGTFAFLIFDRRPQLQSAFLALSLLILFGILHLVRGSFVNIAFIDQDRYAAEVSFALAFFWGILISWVFDLIRAGKVLQKNPFVMAYRTRIAYAFIFLILGLLVISILLVPRGL